MRKPRVYIEIWTLESGFDIQGDISTNVASGAAFLNSKNEMTLKAKMTGHAGIFESDLLDMDSNPLEDIITGKRIKSIETSMNETELKED